MRKLLRSLNPIAHLGDRRYSILFPTLITIFCAVLLEVVAFQIARNADVVGLFAIFIFVALIMYFAFREGIRGGMISAVITIVYYGYIIYTRHYTGDRLISSINTTIILGILYCVLAGIIGWLKETIDILIDNEADERRRLQAIVQQLPVGVIITDEKGTVVQVNRQVDEILGVRIPVGFTVKDKPLVQAVEQGEIINNSQTPIMQTLASGKPIVGKEYEIDRKDGKHIHIQVSASAIHNKRGKIIAAASIISNITEQKEIEARKDDFVNMASHELKTPITSLKLYIDLLKNKAKNSHDEKAVAILGNIKDQTDRLQRLVNDLLDVSRLQTGKLTFDKEKFRIDILLRETVEVLKDTTKKQKIVFTKKSSLSVYADKFRMYQVLTNLITNAIKYSGEGKQINVGVYKDGNKATVFVQDFGIGIAKDQQKRIFERLYQVNDDKEKSFPGFGMGLYISKEIIKRHKGNIWVDSKKREGSTFYFSLPLINPQ